MNSVSPERQRMMDYLLRFHLAPQNIKTSDWDEDGFYAYNPITGNLSGKIPWPDGFNYGWFCKLYHVADIADFRRAGLRNHVTEYRATHMVQ